jgi:hypothetical protein
VTALEASSAAAIRMAARGARTALLRTFDDGRPMMVVEENEHGYRVWAPRFGHHFVFGDGGRVLCALPRIAAWRWERLLFAQVLPLAAALRGRELFHASAVVLEGRAVGFVGLSGAGKSSTAAHLVSRGATFLTDDVLALEVSEEGLLAHPGTGLVGLDPRELARMPPSARGRLGAVVGRSGKVYLAVAPASGAVPLAALYFLVAAREGTRLRIESVDESAALLLSSSFLSYLASPVHLLRHLDACAHIAQSVPTFLVAVPPSVDAVQTAVAIEQHAFELMPGEGR